MSIDAIKEFKVQTGLYPAEFGRELGQVNVSTISGGNQYHGSLFEFLRNNKVDAVTYQFTPVAPVTPPFKWNQYGFTLDGPLSIPKVFNARNKLFFMVNFEGFNQRGLTNTVYNVPTPAMRGGDLSGGLTAAGPAFSTTPLGVCRTPTAPSRPPLSPATSFPQPDHAGFPHNDDLSSPSEPAGLGDRERLPGRSVNPGQQVSVHRSPGLQRERQIRMVWPF